MKRMAGLVLIMLFVAVSASGQDVSAVTARGSAKIVKGNTEAAKKAALEEAKRNAVEQVGSEVISDTVVENFELVRDRIITRVAGYVKGYEITNESCTDARCQVEIKAQVSAKELKDDATLIYQDMNKPRVMVLVPETDPSGQIQVKSSLAENALMEYFKEKGFELIDRDQALANIEADKIRAAASGDAKAAAMLGSRAGAEVIIVGTANLGKPESIHNILYASTPTVSVRAINTANASIYATASQVGKGQGGTPDQAQKTALQNTARAVGKEIFWKIVKQWNQEMLNGRPVEVVAKGVSSFSRLTRLKKGLAGLEGVKEVVQREYAAPAATLTVYFLGEPERLAELIESANLAQVTGVSQGKITITLK